MDIHHAKDIQDPTRPLFFVGHSLGGIVIKEVGCLFHKDALERARYLNLYTSNISETFSWPLR